MRNENQNRPGTKSKNNHSPLSRRDFMKLGIGTLSALAVMEIGGASVLYMRPRSLEGEFGGVVNAGPVDSFPLGSAVHFPNGRFYLVRAQDGGILAIYQRCTHLGCSVSWEPDKGHFFCPCHASQFDIHGDTENPPAPRALDTFPVQIENGHVLVDTSEIQTRDSFQTDQLVYVEG